MNFKSESIQNANNKQRNIHEEFHRILQSDLEPLKGEIIEPVNNYPNYWTSNKGRVISTKRAPKFLSQFELNGYKSVSLYKDGESQWFSIHHLVLETFVGPRPTGHLCRHLNDVKHDNRLENLAYGTPAENQRDSLRNGNGTFSYNQVKEIRKEFATGDLKQSDLADKYGSSQQMISFIVTGRCYEDAGGPITKTKKPAELTYDMIRLKKENDLTYSEIGDIFNLSTSAVYARINYSKESKQGFQLN